MDNSRQASMAGSVQISLRLDEKSTEFQERRLVLKKDNSSITVGRASRTQSKGYVAADSNAWFESAVMSRNHAEITAHFENMTVDIKDLQSLHGTFLNESRIQAQKSYSLSDGDRIRFGVPVNRNDGDFVPTTVKVGITFDQEPENSSTTFQVPEGSDDGSEAENSAPIIDLTESIDMDASTLDTLIRTGATDSNKRLDFIDLSSPRQSPSFSPEHYMDSWDSEDEDDFTQQPLNRDDTVSQRLPRIDATGNPWTENSEKQNSYFSQMADMGDNDTDDDGMSDPSENSEVEYDDGELQFGDGDEEGYDHDLDSASDKSDLDDGNSSIENMEILDSGSLYDEEIGEDEMVEPEAPRHLPHDDGFFNLRPEEVDALAIPRTPKPTIPQTESTCDKASDNKDAAPMAEAATKLTAPVTIQALLNVPRTLDSPASHFVETPGAVTRDDSACLRKHASSVHDLCNKDGEDSYGEFAPGNAASASRDSLPPRPKDTANPVDLPVLAPVPSVFGYCGNAMTLNEFLCLGTRNSHLGTEGLSGTTSRRTYFGIPDIVETPEERAEKMVEQEEIPMVETHAKGKRKAEDISNSNEAEEAWLNAMTQKSAAAPLSPAISPPLTPIECPDRTTSECEITPVETKSAPAPTPITSVTLSEKPSPSPEEVPKMDKAERSVKRQRLLDIAERVGYAALGGVTAGAMIVGTLIYTAPTFA